MADLLLTFHKLKFLMTNNQHFNYNFILKLFMEQYIMLYHKKSTFFYLILFYIIILPIQNQLI